MKKQMVELIDNIYNNKYNFESDYIYNGFRVPRVTKIISKCIHNESFMSWANSLGFKHQSYKKVLEKASNIGTQCHNSIDKYLEDNSFEPDNIENNARNAYNAFLKWFNSINSVNNVKVIFHEQTLICKYFGGTLDGLYEINGKKYLIDYKTSNHISYNYFLQLAAYRYMLREIYNIEIDGCIILQLNKYSVSYNEYLLDFSNIEHFNFINLCEQTFLSLVYSYYSLYSTEQSFINIFKNKV